MRHRMQVRTDPSVMRSVACSRRSRRHNRSPEGQDVIHLLQYAENYWHICVLGCANSLVGQVLCCSVSLVSVLRLS